MGPNHPDTTEAKKKVESLASAYRFSGRSTFLHAEDIRAAVQSLIKDKVADLEDE